MGTLRLTASIGSLVLLSFACSDPEQPRSAFACTGDAECGSGVCTAEGQCTCPDQTCPSGSYCGANLCWQDCTASSGGCRAGQVCTDEGRCIAAPQSGTGIDSGGFGDGCPGISVDLNNEAPTVVLLIDQSGSMREPLRRNDNSSPSRWEAVQEALVGPQGVVAQRETSVVFGTTLYQSEGGNEGGTCPMLEIQPPQLGNLSSIRTLIENNRPGRDTPTAEAVVAVTDSFPAANGSRVILLATDGDPDSCEDPDSNGQSGPKEASEKAVQRAYEMGISTTVLSVGRGVVDREHLERLARAGAGQNLDTGSAVAYETDDPTVLANTFSAIVDQVRNCQFGINGTVDSTQASSGRVFLNGEQLAFGDDWQLSSAQTLELLGDSCEAFKNASKPQLEATFPCGSVILR